MRRMLWMGNLTAAALLALPLLGTAHAHDAKKHAEQLPPGPIRDRHELMEGIGKQAKKIGAAMKAGQTTGVAPAAEAISASAKKILPLFPPGSTHEYSRAKPEIWQNWAEFEQLSNDLVTDSAALAAAAKENGDVKAASQKMFQNCKSCHEKFRIPEK